MRTRSQTRNHNRQQQAPPAVVEPFNLEEPFDNLPLFLVLYDSCDLDDYRMSLLVWLEPVVMNPTLAGMRHHHSPTFVYPNIKQLSNKRWAWTANMALSFIPRISLTGFPAQSVGSSNTDVLDLPSLLILITGTSQSRQHESCKSPTAVLFEVDTGRILFVTVNTKEYHSECSGRITRIMRRTLVNSL
ncbi:hypothetical protein Tco_1484157 [Tanacetum coccineum]